MTREHKLALIVGFSLVLVVGVLISDHFSKARTSQVATEMTPAGAPEFGAGTSGLRVVGVPGSVSAPMTTPVSTVPQGALPSASEETLLASDPTSTAPTLTMGERDGGIVHLLGGNQNAALAGTSETQIDRGVMPPGSGDVRPIPPETGTLAAAPERAEPVAPMPVSPAPAVPERARVEMVNGVPVNLMKRHDVREGETLYRIAQNVYGDGRLWTKLPEYNKGKLGPNNSLRIGVTLLLPPKEALLGKPLPTVQPSEPAARPSSARPESALAAKPAGKPESPAAKKNEKPAQAAKTYTVQKGDSLSEIARRTLGSSKRWNEIVDLNRDTLTDEDSLVVGAVIKLPGR